MLHDWKPSKLGHGNMMCSRCYTTDLEAAALGITAVCDAPAPPPPKAANANRPADDGYDEIDDGDCPACGGSGVADDECTCMDDACCCLHPTPPVCGLCGGAG